MIDVDLRRYGSDKEYEKEVNDYLSGTNTLELYFNEMKEKIIEFEETKDEFIFSQLSKYCDGVIEHESDTIIPKRLLIRALTCFKQEHKEEWDVLMKMEERNGIHED